MGRRHILRSQAVWPHLPRPPPPAPPPVSTPAAARLHAPPPLAFALPPPVPAPSPLAFALPRPFSRPPPPAFTLPPPVPAPSLLAATLTPHVLPSAAARLHPPAAPLPLRHRVLPPRPPGPCGDLGGPAPPRPPLPIGRARCPPSRSAQHQGCCCLRHLGGSNFREVVRILRAGARARRRGAAQRGCGTHAGRHTRTRVGGTRGGRAGGGAGSGGARRGGGQRREARAEKAMLASRKPPLTMVNATSTQRTSAGATASTRAATKTTAP